MQLNFLAYKVNSCSLFTCEAKQRRKKGCFHLMVSSVFSEAMAIYSCFFPDPMCCPNLFQGENLDLAISKDEVMAMIGEGICVVKTLTRNHLYCEPPSEQPAPRHRTKREGTDLLPEFTVGNGQLPEILKHLQEVGLGCEVRKGRNPAEGWGKVTGLAGNWSCSPVLLFWAALCPLCSFWRSPVALYFIPA